MTAVSDAGASNPRSRAGNAMGRTRAAVLEGARAVLLQRGVRAATMAEVAAASGLAKATIYNHVRNKDELLLLVVSDAVDGLFTVAGDALTQGATPAQALVLVADVVVADPLVRAVATNEPAALLPLLAAGSGASTPLVPRIVGFLTEHHCTVAPAEAELILRWLLSLVLAPGNRQLREAQASTIAGAIPRRAPTTRFARPAT